jgi:anti-sigma B factor antagonist
MAAFAIEVSGAGQRCDMTVSGEIDLEVAQELTTMGLLSLNSTPAQTLVLDLAAVTFIDSTGLGALVVIRNAAQDIGKDVVLCRVPDRVAQVLAITGLDQAFAVESST